MGWQAERRQRLAEQAEPAESQLFRGISFYLNGQTGEVSALRLTKLIQRFGGATTPFPSASTSYMIGTALASGKLQRYLSSKSWRSTAAATMLRPEWIHDCIAAGALVPVTKYLVVKDTTMRQIDSYVRAPPVPAVVPSVAETAATVGLAPAGSAPPSTEAAAALPLDRLCQATHDSRVHSATATAPSAGARLQVKLETYRIRVQLKVARRLERFDNDDNFRLRVLAQHVNRQSYSESVVRSTLLDRHRHLSRGGGADLSSPMLVALWLLLLTKRLLFCAGNVQAAELAGKLSRAEQRVADACAAHSKKRKRSTTRKPRGSAPVSPSGSPVVRSPPSQPSQRKAAKAIWHGGA